jgi:hypothetical protein
MTFVGPPDSRQTRPATPQLPPFVNFMLDAIDKFPALQHALNRNAIIDGDTYFLHAAVSSPATGRVVLCEKRGGG